MPPNGGPDESAHVIRAAGVASGQIRPTIGGDGAYGAKHNVPGGYELSLCYNADTAQSADCMPAFDKRDRWVVTAAGRYFPGYYAMVGVPLNLWPGPIGLMLARLISAALAAAFLACAFVTLARWSKHGLMLGGLVVAVTPMVAHVAATINPNGLEIAAGVALFASLIPLALGERDRPVTPLVLLYGASAIFIVSAKTNGPVWLGIATLPFLFPWRRSNFPHLFKTKVVRLCVLAIALAGLISAVWIVSMRAHVVIPLGGRDFSRGQALIYMVDRWPTLTREIVGIIGWGVTPLPELVYPLWLFACGSLPLFAMVVGTRLDRWRLGTLIALTIGVPFTLQLLQMPKYGFITQGRYLLPLLVGIPLLAAWIIEQRAFDAARSRAFTRVLAGLLLPLHLISLAWVMVRWQQGLVRGPAVARLDQINPFVGKWLPPTGPVVPLVMVVAGAALMLWLLWRARPMQLAGTPAPAAPDVADAPTQELRVVPPVPSQRQPEPSTAPADSRL
jgi:hypothetical protein